MSTAGVPSWDQEASPDWGRYYDAVAGKPARDTLLLALARFPQEPAARRVRFAVDLGCGEGRDTAELLRRGWRVLAIDGDPRGIERLRTRADVPPNGYLEMQVTRLEHATWPAADLVNASFALPFCPPEHFPALWERIAGSLLPDGRFAGQLFGDRDTWATIPGRTHHTRAAVETLLQPFEVEHLDEEAQDGQTAVGTSKYWHIFHVVARKR